jgi:Flp pilus assembly protein TadG
METRTERGQALILLALAFVGLAAFIGLTIDGGILFTDIGHLRRAVDAGALAAAGQFRENRTLAEMTASAMQILSLNNLGTATALVETCGTNPGDPELCFTPPRKMVRVTGTLPVQFAFLPIIGWSTINIHANAVSETASVDIVLVVDTSSSMAKDGPIVNPSPAQIAACSAAHTCQPFEDVRTAASALAAHLYYPYDRMALVTFAANAIVQKHLPDCSDVICTVSALNSMAVSSDPCGSFSGDPTGCTNTNTSDALKFAGNEFGLFKREEAVWIVILLSDGAANAAKDTSNIWICPGSPGAIDWVQPFCRDARTGHRHISTDSMYDPDDAARDNADWVGCPDSNSLQPAACAHVAPGGQGAVIFTIGLGSLMTNNTVCQSPWPPIGSPGGCEPDRGEKLLRYVAAVGDDGNPATDPCSSVAIGTSCGNYYYSPTGAGLLKVFEAIASRIFTRITH